MGSIRAWVSWSVGNLACWQSNFSAHRMAMPRWQCLVAWGPGQGLALDSSLKAAQPRQGCTCGCISICHFARPCEMSRWNKCACKITFCKASQSHWSHQALHTVMLKQNGTKKGGWKMERKRPLEILWRFGLGSLTLKMTIEVVNSVPPVKQS